MLNLMKIEARKLFRGKIFRLTVAIYLISIIFTFIPLSFTSDLVNLIPDDTQKYIAENVDSVGLAIDTIKSLKENNNFIMSFYNLSSGQILVVLVFLTISVLHDFSSGMIRNTLLCGYSRRKLYLSRLATGIAGSCAYYLLSLITLLFLGAFFYRSPLTANLLRGAILTLLGQCLVSIEYVSVFTAFAMAFGNGWAILADFAFFTALPSLPLLAAFIQGRNQFLASYILPSFISVNGVGGFMSLDMMLASPHYWTPRFIYGALTVLVIITVASTLWGMRMFNKKQL